MSDAIESATSKNPSIDAEHHIQIELVQALCDAAEAGQPSETVQTILQQLTEYSEAHFVSEEMLMRMASYDDYDDHVADHDGMIEALQEIKARHQQGQSDLVAGKAKATLAFLLKHIETRDRRFQEWKR